MKTTSYTDTKQYAFNKAPRCGARTKINYGLPCQNPAVRGKRRCRMHGGSTGSGAPLNNINAIKHGQTTASVKKLRHAIRKSIQSIKTTELYQLIS
jgi:hypothetical protein